MATLKVLKVIAEGSGQTQVLRVQPKLDGTKNIGGQLTVNCPGQKNGTSASKRNFTGNDHSLSLNNVDSPAVYECAASISPINLESKEAPLTPKPFANITLKVIYAVDSNIVALTLDYFGIVGNLIYAFIRDVAIATAQYFSSLIILIVNPIIRLLGLRKPSEIDQLIDQIDREGDTQVEKINDSSNQGSDEDKS